MAMLQVNSFFRQISEAIENGDGFNLGLLFSLQDVHMASPFLQLPEPESQCENWFFQPWDAMVAAHLRCLWAIATGDFIEAYRCQNLCIQSFIKLFQNQKEENWCLPVMFSLARDLRILANKADLELQANKKGKPGETVEKAADSLMGCFRICASDNRAAAEDSKKWGMLNLVNQLFKIYFKINKLHLCKPMIRAIDSLPIKDKFSTSELVTYRYFLGVKAMFDGELVQAQEYLAFAFSRCPRICSKNKRLILINLLPVKMLLGYIPKENLLKEYRLHQFSDVVIAVRQGNVSGLTDALQRHEMFFIKYGIYLILDKLEMLTYRNLFKKVFIMMKTFRLPIGALTCVTRTMVADIDDDEVECILVNLIDENKLKGYISHQHKILVLSKSDAFPPLPFRTAS